MPLQKELEAFARANRFAMKRCSEPWQDYIAQVTAHRTARGEGTPTSPPDKSQRPDYTQTFEHILNDRALPHSVRKRWSEPDCVECIVDFLRWLPAAMPPTVDAYKGFTETRPETPWPRTFEQYGGFPALHSKAQEEIRRRAERS